ncbi:SusE domain-containing protein [Flavobacteriaceae bacterium]|nr:SusE domain-containing protein [Flavobacteriaceae bacterium]
MKSLLNIKKTVIAAVLLFAATSCEKEDFLIFTATTNGTLSIQNELQPVYKLSNATSTNIAERLVWNEPDFDAPTTVTYLAEFSTDSNFSSINLDSGDTSNNHFGISISDLITMATALGLDEDPSTTNDAGEPNTKGSVYARVKAFAGSTSSGANQVVLTSPTVILNIEMLEAAASCEDATLSTWGACW